MLGFGFDIINKVYKVVVLFLWANGRVLESETQVFTLGSSLWRTVNKAPKMRFVKGCSAYVNGSLHWLTRGEPGDGSRSKIIVSFTLSSEEFGVIPSPEFNYLSTIESFKADSLIQLVELRECLSIVDSSFDHHIEIWVMKDYNVKESWTRFCVSKYYLEGMQFKLVNAISFRQNNEIVLLCDFLSLVSYNTETGNFTTVEVGGLNNNADDFRKYYGGAFSYVESLISPKSACRI
ncbi:hypothetical protein AQUCO_04700013v1 [Aquilegia coerulea]|uniref:F-box associated beta-propeller type 3 domain-containing protein n=1 Tax=Aquilegia coerulea TaxID=218851 RepID=A0A2G5CKR9_AQUCA|nr:hypothetical protein AQUCO_04700013v1 [Aquilegia coerulea]